ncbi:MAG: SMP-30/gluconolactonase/LRE family protein, partial [Anaerolineales bacterium]
LVAVLAVFGTLLGANPPMQGSELPQLQATGAFVSSLIVSAIGLAAIYRLGGDLGWRNVARLAVLSFFGLLALLTARAAFIAAYVNYDYANEFLVYAHGARGVKTVMEQVEDISERTTDGLGLKVAYDDAVTWPMTWYLRDYNQQAYFGAQPTRESLDAPVVVAGPKNWDRVERLLGERYYQFEYIRMVWPMQDYFNLTWDRIRGSWSNRDFRQAFWDIWFNRDYTRYGTLTNTSYDLSQWPVSERMRFYVRKDIAAQIWTYGVGPTTLEVGGGEQDPYLASKQTIQAEAAWGGMGSAPGQFNAPRAVAIGPDGAVYVADSRNHRIQKFDGQGNLLTTWGTFGSLDSNTADPGKFNEPWGVAVGPDGSVYVADTWNHRVQKFDANGQFLTQWGHFGQAESFDAFWGPRAVAVTDDGKVFVADTGNKRVAVFDTEGNGLLTVGGGGSDPGLLDEPVGVAVGEDGTLYVADTWNL